MTAATATALRDLATILAADDEAFMLAADSLTDSRNLAPRVTDPESGEPADRDVVALLDDLITALRTAAEAQS